MRWAHDHPEEYREIAALPLNQQNAALRAAIGYDPDAIRDRQKEDALTTSRPGRVESPSSLTESRSGRGGICEVCGAPSDAPCASYCTEKWS